VWLIGGDDNFVKQILVVLKVGKKHKERKRKCSVRWITNEQGCEKKYKRWSEELTSGTMKLTAILPRGG